MTAIPVIILTPAGELVLTEKKVKTPLFAYAVAKRAGFSPRLGDDNRYVRRELHDATPCWLVTVES